MSHDVVDPGGVFVGGVQFDEVVEPALVEGAVAFEGVEGPVRRGSRRFHLRFQGVSLFGKG